MHFLTEMGLLQKEMDLLAAQERTHLKVVC